MKTCDSDQRGHGASYDPMSRTYNLPKLTRNGSWGRRDWFKHCGEVELGGGGRAARKRGVRGGAGQCEEPRACVEQCACDPDSRAVVEEVFGIAAPGEGFIGGLLPDGFEEVNCLAMGEDRGGARIPH